MVGIRHRHTTEISCKTVSLFLCKDAAPAFCVVRAFCTSKFRMGIRMVCEYILRLVIEPKPAQ